MKSAMTIRIDVSALDMTPDQFDELRKIHPEAVSQSGRSLLTRVSLNDARAIGLLRALQRHGFVPHSDANLPRPTRFYSLKLTRHYSDKEIDSCELLDFVPQTACNGRVLPGHGGLLVLNQRKLKRNARIAGADHLQWIVSSELKRLLEQSDLRGLSFKPTLLGKYTSILKAKIVPWEGEAFWELTCERKMPPMASWMRMDRQIALGVGPWFPGAPGSAIPYEPPYTYAEMHYRRSDVMIPPDSDLYRTFEYMGMEHIYPKIASRRFYEFCKSQQLKIDWYPVRLDPDSGPEGGPLPHYPPELLDFLTPRE